METSAALSEHIERTSARGWAVLLLNRLQLSTVVLSSFAFGIFLPFITVDLGLTPLEAGLLQGIWWATSATLVLPFGVWFSKYRPVKLVLVSLVLLAPFIFLQGLAMNFAVLFAARFFTMLFHIVSFPARPLLFQQWASTRQYTLINAFGQSQHSVLLAVAVSTSALLIAALGSWRVAYFIQGGLILVHIVAWIAIARDSKAPVRNIQSALESQVETPLSSLKKYPQCWLMGITMFSLAATWTSVVTFLPTLLLEDRGIDLRLGGPILAFLYYGLIPGSLLGGLIARRVQNRKVLLAVPALANMLLGIAVTVTANPWLLVIFISGVGLVWVAVPAIELLPFEYPNIRPREVTVVTSLAIMFNGVGFATGPVLVGAIAQYTGSLQTGLISLALLTGVGVVSGLLYPARVAK